MGMGYVVGLEVEMVSDARHEEHLGDEHIGGPGVRGRPLKCVAPEPGFSYHSESNMDLMQPVLRAWRGLRKNRLAVAFHRERVGPGAGGVHVRGG